MTRRTLDRNYLGIHFEAGYNGSRSVGQGWVRLWDCGVTAKRLEPSKGSFDWTTLDGLVDAAEARGDHILLTLGQYGEWATGDAANPGSNYNPNPVIDGQDVVDHLTPLATRYAGRISAYEVWNEPNLDTTFWTGTVAQMVTQHQLTYQTIKAIDPAAIIVGASPTTGAGTTYLDSMLAAGAGQYMDAVGFHYYIGSQQPEYLFDAFVALKVNAIKRAYGVQAKPTWNTEWTYNTYTGQVATDPMGEDMAVSYFMRHLLCTWLARTDRSAFYGLDFASWNKVGWPAKVAGAFAYFSDLFADGGQLYNCRRDAGDLYSARFATNRGLRGRVFWHKDGLSSQPDLSAFSSARDVEGNAVSLAGLTVTNIPVWCFS